MCCPRHQELLEPAESEALEPEPGAGARRHAARPKPHRPRLGLPRPRLDVPWTYNLTFSVSSCHYLSHIGRRESLNRQALSGLGKDLWRGGFDSRRLHFSSNCMGSVRRRFGRCWPSRRFRNGGKRSLHSFRSGPALASLRTLVVGWRRLLPNTPSRGLGPLSRLRKS